jgi:serine/threonine protein kinase
MMYEMLAGERPFRADSLDLLLARHLSAPTPKLPAGQESLQPVVDKLMAKDPAERYPSARSLLDELAQRPLTRTSAGPAG